MQSPRGPQVVSDRGLANAAVVMGGFFGGLVAGAILWIMLDQAVDPVLTMTQSNASLAVASTGTGYARQAWEWGAFFIMVLSAIAGVAGMAAVTRSP